MKLYNLNDPGWGKGNQNQDNSSNNKPNNSGGPPDLDEVWQDFNKRLGGMFKKHGNRGGGSRPPAGGMPNFSGPSPKLIILVVIAAILVWLASGFVIVQEGQVSVVTRFGKYVHTLSPGLQWRMPYPIEDSQKVDIAKLRTFEVGFRGSSRNRVLPESLMLTNDENIVDVQFVAQYRLMPDGAPAYLFNTSNPDESVRQAVETAMREIVGRKPMDFVLYSGRTEVAQEVQSLAQSILERYKPGIQLSTVAIQNVQPPEPVQDAFDDAVKAGQDRERQINEGNAYASKVVPEAQGQAARMVQEAEGYGAKVIGEAQGNSDHFKSIVAEYNKAPEITRERMYLQAMQDILSNSSKIMIDGDASNNMLYLPLDKLANQSGASSSSSDLSNLPSTSQLQQQAAQAAAALKSSSTSNTNKAPNANSAVRSLMSSPYSN